MTLTWLISQIHDQLAALTLAKTGLVVGSTAGILLAIMTVGLYIARKLLSFGMRTIRSLVPMMMGVSLLCLGTAGVSALGLITGLLR